MRTKPSPPLAVVPPVGAVWPRRQGTDEEQNREDNQNGVNVEYVVAPFLPDYAIERQGHDDALINSLLPAPITVLRITTKGQITHRAEASWYAPCR
jgi:hypothetical protein